VTSITVTVEQPQGQPPPGSRPPPPPSPQPPPPSGCTKTLAAGGDLSTFLSTLRNGDAGCLRGGEYRDGCAVSWDSDAASGIVLRSYPGEQAILHTSLGLAGNNLTASRLRITGINPSCGAESGFTVQGANDVVEYSSVYDVSRHGILQSTSATNTIIHGNFIESVGSECNLDHGIYFQKSGRITRNVFKDIRCGYAIHLYAHPSHVVVAENTSVGSRVRAGIIIRTDGSDIAVVNNIFSGNATYGIYYVACGSGCVVDRNITWGNTLGGVGGDLGGSVTGNRDVDPQFTDARYHVAGTSPAVDTGRNDYADFPDLDGVQGVAGSGPDLGAYER
jgi:hypothetical protein